MALRNTAEDNWIVADSEDEDSFVLEKPDLTTPPAQGDDNGASVVIPTLEQFPSHIVPLRNPVDTSAISVFSTNPRPATASTISFFPPPSEQLVTSTSISRPRPRPVTKRTKASSEISPSDSPVIQTPSPDKAPLPTIIADPSLQQSSLSRLADEIPGVDYSQGVAERAKMRSRKAAKVTIPQVDVIDISSDDDELFLRPSKSAQKTDKSRPKPRPVKRAKPATPHPADISITESETTIPVPSSSFPVVPRSDPLPSSSAPRSSSSSHPQARTTLAPESSSPPSTSSSKKRKRPLRIEPDDEGDGAGTSMDVDKDSTLMPPPPAPPLFLADSFEPVEIPGLPAPPRPKKNKKSDKKAKKAGDDAEGAKKPKAKPGKRKQKSTVEVVIGLPKRASKNKNKDGDFAMEDVGPNNPAMPQVATGPPSPNEFRGSLSPVPNSEDEDELQLIPPTAKQKPAPASRKAPPKTKPSKGKATADNGAGGGDAATKKPRKKSTKKAVVLSDDREEAGGEEAPSTSVSSRTKGKGKSKQHASTREVDEEPEPEVPSRTKENIQPPSPEQTCAPSPKPSPPAPATPVPTSSSTTRRWTFARPKATPMQEIIRRAASHAGSSPVMPGTFSPLAKSSKSMLRRIAPLHPNRRTPPPPPPRPPPPKKTKKMLDLEEKWEMELEDEVEGWYALTDEERTQWRRAKRNKELGSED